MKTKYTLPVILSLIPLTLNSFDPVAWEDVMYQSAIERKELKERDLMENKLIEIKTTKENLIRSLNEFLLDPSKGVPGISHKQLIASFMYDITINNTFKNINHCIMKYDLLQSAVTDLNSCEVCNTETLTDKVKYILNTLTESFIIPNLEPVED